MFEIIHKTTITRILSSTAKTMVCAFVWMVFSSFVTTEDTRTPLVEAKVVKVYPNPAVSYINFEFSEGVDRTYTLTIYNFVGKRITGMAIENSKITLTLTDYYRGLYIYQLKDKTGKVVETGKFQVNQ